MRYQSVDDISAHAHVTVATRLSREARLNRWADLLEEWGARPLKLFTRIEYQPEAERMAVRQDDSPMTTAYADPVLREAGLAGDTFGDAVRFFELSQHEAHELLCDCHYFGKMDGSVAARRVRQLAGGASPLSFATLFGRG
jgi:hypothetical protein